MDNPNQPPDLKDVEALALNLVELIGRTIGASPSRNVTNSSGRGNSSAAHPLPTAAAAATPPPAAPQPSTSGIQIEMARLFPGHFGRGGPRPKRGQKRFAHPPKPRMRMLTIVRSVLSLKWSFPSWSPSTEIDCSIRLQVAVAKEILRKDIWMICPHLSTCRKCGQSMPLQLLGIHLEECRDYNAEYDEFGDTDTDEVLLVSSSKETVVEVISFQQSPAEFLEIHASTCGESNHPAETANQGSEESLYGQADHGNEDCVAGPSQIYTMAPDAAWKPAADPQRATEVFRRTLLGQREEMAPLRLSIDIREDVDKQEMAIISFYKSRQTKWSRPLRWTLEGDVAMEMV
ncbi:hypothetical protein CgunFtcFv8_026150 [Champsocephalus gunnari]|uniref:Uncharacterized protein n=1 Tax=Champsocephalus gunnari TaxID=52237 RepID=A0AAN8CF46_CHAGU|nr:hypothetical protein CgunFtcFv8_026150 [Champsocephalus gunnari]